MSTTPAWVHFFIGTVAFVLAVFVLHEAYASLRDIVRMLRGKDVGGDE